MSITVKLKHSATANKVPLPTDLAEGELALNINTASPAAYLKDSAGVVRKIAGTTVGGTAPATPTAGMAWLDIAVPTKPVFKVYDGTAWQGAGSGTSTGAAMPTAPAAGDLWVDTTVPTAPVLKVHNGTAFVALAPDATETTKGIVELATAAETTAGTDATRAVHPAGLKAALTFTQAGAGAKPRSIESKLRDTVSVKDFGAVGDGVADDTAAIQAALTSLGANGTLILDGRFKVTSSLVKTGIEYLEIKGSKDALIDASGAIDVFDLTLQGSQRRVVIKDLNIYPTGATQVSSVFKISGSYSASSAYSNLIASNITCDNLNGSTGTASTAKVLFKLSNIWAPRITDCVFFAPTLQPAATGTSFMTADWVVDATLTNCILHFGDSLIHQLSYCEGFNATGCSVVGSNYAINQAAGGWTGLAGRKLYQMQFSHCELNTFYGSFAIANTVNLKTVNCAHTRSGNNAWVCYSLTDCDCSTFVGDLFIGGGSPGGTRTAINLGGTSVNNMWASPNFWAVDSLAVIGASCTGTVISDGSSKVATTPYSAVTNSGTGTVLDIDNFKWGSPIKASNNGNALNPTEQFHEFQNNVPSQAAGYFYHDSKALTANVLGLLSQTAAAPTWSLLKAWSAGFSDIEFNLRGDGSGFCDGAWTGGGADYAEYFEWSDGNLSNEDRRGVSVVLNGDKIRKALPGENPIGVISGNPSIVGDSAWNKWNDKYLRDEFNAYILEDYEVINDEGEAVVQQRRKLNPAYDPNVEYTPREERLEWDAVGLMGKLRIRKGQPVAKNWIKMKDVNDTVEEWLIR